jgi:acyl dehydratase
MTESWFEDVRVGERVDLGSYRFAAEGIIDFAARYDPQSFRLSEEGGRLSHFGALCASGWQTTAAFMQCLARTTFRRRAEAAKRGEALPPLGPSPGFADLKWIRPVFAGDTVAYTSTVASKRELKSRPGWGLVTFHNEGINQKGETVMTFTGKLLVARRPS